MIICSWAVSARLAVADLGTKGYAMTTAVEAPHVQIMRMLQAPLVTQALAVAAELGIADLVAEGPRTVEDLAAQVKADPAALYRLLRALAGFGVFSEVSPRTFASTALAEPLRQDQEGSLRNVARIWGIPERQAAIGALLHSVLTGEPSFPHLYGISWWSQLAARPDQAAVFAAAMGDASRHLHAATLDAYDLSHVGKLVDVGGGHGYLAAELLRRYPALRATVFDQPDVVKHAPQVLAGAGVADRARVAGGDFFASVPAGADAYLMSMVLHDWDDTQSIAILKNVRRAMGAGGELLVVDAILPEGDVPHPGKLNDLVMLTLHPGQERTRAEFADLFERAGLSLRETREMASSTGLLVAVPAP
jgi:predicted O-methyltransferase YrrM/DNA-binding transcriptional ArsR family regulator